MRARATLITVSLTAVMLSGCTMPWAEDNGGGTFARTMTIAFDPASMAAMDEAEDPFAGLAQVAQTAFVYTHRGSPVDASGLNVVYSDTSQQVRTEPLSMHTSLAKLDKGDTFTVRGVHIASDILLKQGDQTLASRVGTDAKWLEASGMPLPLRVEPGAAAAWTSVSTTSLGLNMDRLDMREDGTVIQDASLALDMRVDMDMDLSGRQDAGALRVDLGAQGTIALTGSADATVSNARDGISFQAGGQGELDAQGDGTLSLFFVDGTLDRFGREGRFHAEATASYWDMDNPRSSPAQAPIPTPLADETYPYTLEDAQEPDLDPGDQAMLDSTRRLLRGLWGITLQPGDTFVMDMNGGPEAMGMQQHQEVRVEAAESHKVAAGTFDALRITSRSTMDLPAGLAIELPAIETTYWVTQGTHVPLEARQELVYLLTADDVAFLRPLVGASVGLPEDAALNLRFDTTMELVSYDPTIQLAGAVFAGSAVLMTPLMAAAPVLGSAYFMGNAFGSEPPMPIPEVSFTSDSSRTSLTVVRASSAHWHELGVALSPAGMANINGDAVEGEYADPMGAVVGAGPVRAGDVVRLCASEAGELGVSVFHLPTQTLIYQGAFRSAPAC